MSAEEIQLPENLTGLVIVASTRAARGIYEDKSGPIAVEWLRSRGFKTPDAVVIEDRQIIDYFNSLIADGKKNNNLPTFYSHQRRYRAEHGRSDRRGGTPASG